MVTPGPMSTCKVKSEKSLQLVITSPQMLNDPTWLRSGLLLQQKILLGFKMPVSLLIVVCQNVTTGKSWQFQHICNFLMISYSGELGHISKRCTQDKSPFEQPTVTCALCGEQGHRVRDCTQKRPQSKPKGCRICEGEDHLAKDCPNREKRTW